MTGFRPKNRARKEDCNDANKHIKTFKESLAGYTLYTTACKLYDQYKLLYIYTPISIEKGICMFLLLYIYKQVLIKYLENQPCTPCNIADQNKNRAFDPIFLTSMFARTSFAAVIYINQWLIYNRPEHVPVFPECKNKRSTYANKRTQYLSLPSSTPNPHFLHPESIIYICVCVILV